jgi:hypothetical protein
MDALVVKYSDKLSYTILGSADELFGIVTLIINNGSFVESGFDLGLTILAKRLGTTSFVFSEIKDFLSGEIAEFTKKMESRFDENENCEYNEFISKKFDELDFDQDSLDHWTKFFAVDE